MATKKRKPAKRKSSKRKVNYAAMAKKYGSTPSKVKRIYARGLAAYASGSRPGMTAHQWASARVKSALTGGKAAKVDRDIIKGKKKTTRKKK